MNWESTDDSISYPVFFINTGITFNLTALISSPAVMALVPLFLLLFLVVRGLPGLLAAPIGATRADKRAIVFFSATGLPIIVAVTQIGVDHGLLDTGVATALVGAGMFSVLLYPLIALSQRKRSPDSPAFVESARTSKLTLSLDSTPRRLIG